MHAQGVKQSVCPSVVVVVIGTKIARSRILGIYVCCKHNQSVDIDGKLVCTHFEKRLMAYGLWLMAYSVTNCAFSVQHACGLLTTPTP